MESETNIFSQDDLSQAADKLEREERQIDRVALSAGFAVSVVTVAVMVLLVLSAEHAWQYGAYLSLGGVPLAFGLFTNFVTRRVQVAVLHRYQEQLTDRLTELREVASRDELTGLFNRRYFYNTLRVELEKCRVSKESLAILLIDIDGLKQINDEYGHSIGDVIISNVAGVISRHTRATDVAARLGGDEFGVVMRDADKRGAFSLAKRLWAELEQSPMYKQGLTEVMVSVSIGVSGYPWGGEDVGELIQWADTDMYANKVSSKLGQQSVPVERPVGMDSLPDDDYVVGI